jgi:hypothetical protein
VDASHPPPGHQSGAPSRNAMATRGCRIPGDLSTIRWRAKCTLVIWVRQFQVNSWAPGRLAIHRCVHTRAPGGILCANAREWARRGAVGLAVIRQPAGWRHSRQTFHTRRNAGRTAMETECADSQRWPPASFRDSRALHHHAERKLPTAQAGPIPCIPPRGKRDSCRLPRACDPEGRAKVLLVAGRSRSTPILKIPPASSIREL